MKSAPLRCGPIAPFLGTVLLLLIRATLHSEFFLSCGDAQSLDIILEPRHLIASCAVAEAYPLLPTLCVLL
jgi:hypothetical protein